MRLIMKYIEEIVAIMHCIKEVMISDTPVHRVCLYTAGGILQLVCFNIIQNVSNQENT